ncbi:large ribosomal subunit protein uL4m isoform X2 [Hylobates moloch]|uniref:large ribosomal subunit protein uL4m isoform X2 n=1 Tax=Hylobates moloch TaxID=81572 RepID=UPI001362A4A9|nr:large ribosomal subunit protein uL4m isoform X2 [Hylobates moloch]
MLQLFRAGALAWLRPTGFRGLSSLAEEAARPTENPEQVASEGLPKPVLRKVELPVLAHRRPVQAWVESLRGFEQERVGLADLHPDVFATAPRLDILHQVAMWQKNFKRISYAKTKTRAEVRGGGRKPWPQKGSGRARHGSIRSPLWRGGPGESGHQHMVLAGVSPSVVAPRSYCLLHRGVCLMPSSPARPESSNLLIISALTAVLERCCPWPPGPHKLLLHAAHEDAGPGPESGTDHQAGPGRPAHHGLPRAAHRRPTVPDRAGALPLLGELRTPRGLNTRGDATEHCGGHL